MNQDRTMLEFLLRTEITYKFLAKVALDNREFFKSRKYANLSLEFDKRIETLSHSTYKFLEDNERIKKLDEDARSIIHVMCMEFPEIISGKLKPCEDCMNYHHYMNAVFERQDKAGKYCQLHDWDKDAILHIIKDKEISQCKSTKWKDHFERTEADMKQLWNNLRTIDSYIE